MCAADDAWITEGQWTNWRKPPMRCPQCGGAIAQNYRPRPGLEHFGVRCSECNTMLRLVRAKLLPDRAGVTNYPHVWVPALATDRRSRSESQSEPDAHGNRLGRILWEPEVHGWSGLGGNTGRTFGFADPSATLCKYPRQGERMAIVPRWAVQLVDRGVKLRSASVVHGELWVVTNAGELRVFPAHEERASSKRVGVTEDIRVTDVPVPLDGAKRLSDEVSEPPAICGRWALFLCKDGSAHFVFRTQQVWNVDRWVDLCERDLVAEWLGAPFVVHRNGNRPPLFAAVGRQSSGGPPVLFVFKVPSEPDGGSHTTLDRPVQVALPNAINVPVQVPLGYNKAADQRKGKYQGQLVWVDNAASVYRLDPNVEPENWVSELVWAERTPATIETAQPPFPPNPMQPSPPPFPPPVWGPPNPLPPSGPPLPLDLALPPPPTLLPPPPTGFGVQGQPPIGPSFAPPPGPGPGAAELPLLRPRFSDCLTVTVEDFASLGASHGRGGVRLWSLQRRRRSQDPVQLCVFCLEGGSDAGTGWSPVGTHGGNDPLRNAENDEYTDFTVSAMAAYVSQLPDSDEGRAAATRAQVMVVASPKETLVLRRDGTDSAMKPPETSKKTSAQLACTPLVTPFGVVVFWQHQMDVWSFDRQGEVFPVFYPRQDGTGTGGHTSAPGIDPGELFTVVGSTSYYRTYPAMVGNRLWLPTEEGRLYCFDILPESMVS